MWSGTAVAAATSERAFLAALLEAEVALARALADCSVIPAAAAEVIARAADPAAFDPRPIALRAVGGGNPVIPLLADLRERVDALDPAAVAAVHRGATSQDIIDTALMLLAARSLDIMIADVRAVGDALVRLADDHRHTVMAARTLTQQGVPTTFGLKAAGWLSGLTAALAGLETSRSQLPVQLGGAGGTLAASAQEWGARTALVLPDLFASRLRLAAPVLPWHTHRFPMTALGNALVTAGAALGKMAIDVAQLNRTEIGELAEPTGPGRGGSSTMPQKQNPVLSVLITAAARKSSGLGAELQRSALAVDERPDGAWHVEWATCQELLRQIGGACSLAVELAGGLTVNAGRMRANLDLTGGLIVSERLMLVLGPVLGKARLQAIIARAAEAVPAEAPAQNGAGPRQGTALTTLLTDALAETAQDSAGAEGGPAQTAADLDRISIAELLDPTEYLGCSEAFIDRAIAAYRSGG